METWEFEAIGTAWQIDTRAPLAPDLRSAVTATIEEFDRIWSRFRPDSAVSQLARDAGQAELLDADILLGFYDELDRVTGGAVNPLIGQALSDHGYDADYSLRAADVIAEVPPWTSVRRDGDTLTLDEPVLLDVGAAGKGRLVDRVAGVLWSAGVHEATIDASGDLYHCGTGPIKVALEHPADPNRALGVAELEPEDALCGSATNRRSWSPGLHHVLDGRTGRPTTDVVATWVVAAQSCMRADGLATAHFFAPPEALLELHHHEFVRVHADGRMLWSPNFPGEIFR